jgi:hypothetical protein
MYETEMHLFLAPIETLREGWASRGIRNGGTSTNMEDDDGLISIDCEVNKEV